MRAADWVLSLDLSGSGPIFEAECTGCEETSGGADDRPGPEVWCLRHAARTGHTGFRHIVTAFYRATAEQVLAQEQERAR